MRKVYVDVKVRLIIRADEGVDIDDILSAMDYNFTNYISGANIEDAEITDWEITDSK